MADTDGTFDLSGGNLITVRCWSPRVIERTKYFDVYLVYPEYPGMSAPGTSGVQTVKLTAGNVRVTFDSATRCAGCLWLNGIPREQLRQIAGEHEAEFDVGNGKTLRLNESQLAQIRALIAYTDKLPLFDFPPEDMGTNQTNGQ